MNQGNQHEKQDNKEVTAYKSGGLCRREQLCMHNGLGFRRTGVRRGKEAGDGSYVE